MVSGGSAVPTGVAGAAVLGAWDAEVATGRPSGTAEEVPVWLLPHAAMPITATTNTQGALRSSLCDMSTSDLGRSSADTIRGCEQLGRDQSA